VGGKVSVRRRLWGGLDSDGHAVVLAFLAQRRPAWLRTGCAQSRGRFRESTCSLQIFSLSAQQSPSGGQR
jgi:hypothetical protein